MTVIVDDRQILGVVVIQRLGLLGVEHKIVVNKRHGRKSSVCRKRAINRRPMESVLPRRPVKIRAMLPTERGTRNRDRHPLRPCFGSMTLLHTHYLWMTVMDEWRPMVDWNATWVRNLI